MRWRPSLLACLISLLGIAATAYFNASPSDQPCGLSMVRKRLSDGTDLTRVDYSQVYGWPRVCVEHQLAWWLRFNGPDGRVFTPTDAQKLEFRARRLAEDSLNQWSGAGERQRVEDNPLGDRWVIHWAALCGCALGWFAFWVIFPQLFWLGIFTFRSMRRRKNGRCPSCGYDIRASGEFGRCPECGDEVNLHLQASRAISEHPSRPS